MLGHHMEPRDEEKVAGGGEIKRTNSGARGPEEIKKMRALRSRAALKIEPPKKFN